MCGIWGYILKHRKVLSDELKTKLYASFLKIKHRGPDRSDFIEFDLLVPFFLGFHRLAIMDQSSNGDQPFVCEWEGRTIYTLCNGELYNYRDLVTKYQLQSEMRSECDCEIIPHLYKKFGIQTLIEEIKGGEFAFIILDVDKDAKTLTMHVGHDPTGVRPLYYAEDGDGLAFSSELSGLVGIVDQSKINIFPPGSFMTARMGVDGRVIESIQQYYSFDAIPPFVEPVGVDVFGDAYLPAVCSKVRETFEKCVISMLHADRPLGALLSGGLDSSLVVGVAAKYLREQYGRKLRTFSIGMPGGTDGPYATKVAEFCGTEHTHFELTTQDFLDAIRDVIQAIGTFDITTVRASVGQYLVSKKISQETDIKVLLIGDGSDELCSGYMYFHKAPTPEESHKENCRLLKEIGLFDVLRADRGIARHGLEARCPFLSFEFIDLYLKLDCRLRIPVDGVEKWLLRRAFEGADIIPEEVRVRAKCAFSDGVSKKEKSWFQIIGERMADGVFTEDELLKAMSSYKHVAPVSYESLFYRRTFEKAFGNTAHIIPHYWLPKWCGDIKEPSARVLDVCREE